MEQSKSNYAVVCSTFDGNEWLWSGFLQLIDINFNQCPNPIFSISWKSFSFRKRTLLGNGNTDDSLDWSSRMILTLKKIKEPYVLLILDDYFLKGKVDYSAFERAFSILKTQPRIGFVCLENNPSFPSVPFKNDSDFQKTKRTKYRVNAQIGLWKKKYLLRLLRKGESPWLFENFGSVRSYFYSETTLVYKSKHVIFPIHYGGILSKGRLNPMATKFFDENYNIKLCSPSGLSVLYKKSWNPRRRIFKSIYWRLYLPFSIFFPIHFHNEWYN